MKGNSRQIGSAAWPPWQAGFCVLLACLILYNPFAALYCSHQILSVHTPQRNRATVGASELQHFGPVQEEAQQADLTVEDNRHEVVAPARSYVACGFAREEEVQQPEFSAEVWSRPPPTL